MKKKQLYICSWSSGHKPPRPVYYKETEKGWCGTYERAEAMRFATRAAAWQAWKSKHVQPERYQSSIDTGRIRVEPENAPCFCFV